MAADGRGRASTTGTAAEKALRVLEAAAVEPQRLNDIASRAAVPKATAHRLLLMLAAQGYLVAEGGGHYRIGTRLRTLAAQVAARGEQSIDELLRELQAAVDGHTVHLGLRNGSAATYIRKIDADHPYQMASRVGMQLPLHCTAIGKAILAHLPATEVDEVLGPGLPARTPATITSKRRLKKELVAVRDLGYAVDDEENEATIRCIAAPVLAADGHPLGAVSVSTVVFVVTRKRLDSFAPPLRTAAERLSEVLR